MKHFNILLVFCLMGFSLFGQKEDSKEGDGITKDLNQKYFGEKFPLVTTDQPSSIAQKYETLKVSDTLRTNFTATVKEVCQAKGCWMKLELEDGKEVMVRFKDYGFFMPMDIADKEVVVDGIAFVNEMSVADQRHYAKDAGKSESEIIEINKPKPTYNFEASGVLLKQ